MILATAVLSFVLPTITIAHVSLPFIALLTPLIIIPLINVMIKFDKLPCIIKYVIFFFSFIILNMIISDLVNSFFELPSLNVSFAFSQYLIKLCWFLAAFYLTYTAPHDNEYQDKITKLFLISLCGCMLIGCLEWFPWPGRVWVASLYPNSTPEEQLMTYTRDSLSIIRIAGFAQFANSTSGIAVFGLAVALCLFFIKSYRYLCINLVIVALINILATQSRSGIIAFGFLIICLINLSFFTGIGKNFYLIIVIFAIPFLYNYILNAENPFINVIRYRFEAMLTTGGGGRLDQIQNGFDQMHDAFQLFFGISKSVVNATLRFYLETEPLNILVTYGLIGALCHCLFALFLLYYFYHEYKQGIRQYKYYALAALLSFLCYQVFSIGYYFWSEVRVGVIPWIFWGITVGIIESQKKKDCRNLTKFEKRCI